MRFTRKKKMDKYEAVQEVVQLATSYLVLLYGDRDSWPQVWREAVEVLEVD